MAHYDKSAEDFSASRIIQIPKSEKQEKITMYTIFVTLGKIQWTVKRRYSEFFELNEKLVLEFKINKTLLPPKKIFGNQSEEFVTKRRKELEIYLQTVIRHFVNVPSQLAIFLDFQKYEIHGIAQTLAEYLYHKGDDILVTGDAFHTTPLQLYSVSCRMKLAEPTCETGDVRHDIGHILDFFTRLKSLLVEGSSTEIGNSNININMLPFVVHFFKNITCLKLESCNPTKISGVDSIKKTLKKIEVHRSLKSLKEILLVDMGFGQWLGTADEAVLVPAWHSISEANFSRNQITYIDESVKLMPKVKYLDLSHNKLQAIQELQHLPELTHVDLSHNNIKQTLALHTKFGNIKHLNISSNSIEGLQGFSKLYSLESLNLSKNKIVDVREVEHLACLPCLEKLTLKRNPVTTIVDYRACVLELFLDRAAEITLDGEKPSSQESGTIAVRVAMLKSKRFQEKRAKSQVSHEVSVAESSSSVMSSMATSGSESVLRVSPAHEALCDIETADDLGEQAGTVREQTDTARERAVSAKERTGTARERTDTSRERTDAQTERTDPAPMLNESVEPQNIKETLLEISKRSRDRKEKKLEHAHSYRYHYDDRAAMNVLASALDDAVGVAVDVRRDSVSSSSELSADFTAGTYNMTSAVDFILPETMPTSNDALFLEHLQVLTPDTRALGRRSGVDVDHNGDERAVHVLWVPAICYTAPYKEFPTCVCITTENIHIYEVLALTSASELPDLRHLYCIPLMSVQQIALGYRNLYIRVEEAFNGPQGTFTFLTGSDAKTDAFVDSLKLAYRRAVPDLDQYEDPHIIVNGDAEVNLKRLLCNVEQCSADDVIIDLYMLLHTNDSDACDSRRSYTTHSLVITTKYFYILREDYILWPQPTFSIGPSTRPQFEIVIACRISLKMTNFQMYDSDSYSPQSQQTLTETFSATNSSAMLSPNFIGYGVRFSFEHSDCLEIDVRMSTPNMRVRFLEALTRAREKSSALMSKNVSTASDVTCSSSSHSSPHKMKHKSKKRSKTLSKKRHDAIRDDVVTEEDVYHSQGARPKELRSRPDGEPSKQRTKRASVKHAQRVTGNTPPIRYSPTGESEENTTTSLDDVTTSDSAAASPVKDTVRAAVSHAQHVDTVEKSYFETISKGTAAQIDRDVTEEDALLCMTDDMKSRRSKPVPPATLNVGYPTLKLLKHLTRCNEDMPLLRPLSEDLSMVSAMTGEEVLNYFHKSIAQIGLGNEQLQHLCWTDVTPYVNARQLISTCVMLTKQALYLVSDQAPRAHVLKSPWKKHMRNRSDMTQFIQRSSAKPSLNREVSQTAGILHKASARGGTRSAVRAYAVLQLQELVSVDIGLFDHSFRLTCGKPEQVFTCVTRDSGVTEAFLRQLMDVLSLLQVEPSPSPDPLTVSGSEQDFYRMFHGRHHYRCESLEYVHPSRVRFVYPQDDVIQDVRWLVMENSRGRKPANTQTNMLMLLMCYLQQNAAEYSNIDVCQCESRTVVLTERHLTLIAQDCVSYPLPDFATQPPLHKEFEILQVRSLEHLLRVTVSDFRSHDVTLVFADECDEIKVDVSLDYYSPQSGAVSSEREHVPEVTWSLLVQSARDKEQFIKLLSQQWQELHGRELSVQVSA